MPLTSRARDWLATLVRIPAVPTSVVEKCIIDAGYPAHAAWLDFHESYAGYVEEVAPGDLAFWGLMHASDRDPPPAWAEPDKVFVMPPSGARAESIICADAHPVHDYILVANGRFLGLGGPTDSFDRKIERAAVRHEFSARGKVAITKHGRDLSLPDNQALIVELQPSLVPEASDAAAQYYMDATRLLIVAPKSNAFTLREAAPDS